MNHLKILKLLQKTAKTFTNRFCAKENLEQFIQTVSIDSFYLFFLNEAENCKVVLMHCYLVMFTLQYVLKFLTAKSIL